MHKEYYIRGGDTIQYYCVGEYRTEQQSQVIIILSNYSNNIIFFNTYHILHYYIVVPRTGSPKSKVAS